MDSSPVATSVLHQIRGTPTTYTTRYRQLVEQSDGAWALDNMAVCLMRDPFELPKVNLHQGEDRGVYLTPAEARELAEALLRLADLAESTDPRPGTQNGAPGSSLSRGRRRV